MPPKRRNIGRATRRSSQRQTLRRNESDEQRMQQNESNRIRMARSRSEHTDEERQQRNSADRQRKRQNRARISQNEDNQLQQNLNARLTRQNRQNYSLHRVAFQYNSGIDYSLHESVVIGTMNKICLHCKAMKYTSETPGMCCANGKVKLSALNTPPEPLRSLINGTAPQSKHFLANIQKYNSCFQMTSFGATHIIRDNFMPTFKVISSNGILNINNTTFSEIFTDSYSQYENFTVTLQIQGQLYHQAGSLLPFQDASYQFLQIYFIGNADDELDQRCAINTNTKREIVQQLQNLFHEHNELIKLFKTALDRRPSDNHKIVIRADKTPAGEHARRYNAPTIDDVAIVIVRQEFQSRDIVLQRRNNELQRVSETHRSYDALQYPILFCKGDDGYHLNIKMVNPASGKYKISC